MPTTRLIAAARRLAATEAAQRKAGAEVTGSPAMRASVRRAVARAVQRDHGPHQLTQDLVPLVDLTPRMRRAVRNFQQRLLDAGQSPRVVAMRVERYAAQKRRERARAIAVTEIGQAENYGLLDATAASARAGTIRAPEKSTETTSGRPCDDCRTIAGKWVPLGRAFKTSHGRRQAPPFHTKCQCRLKVRGKAPVGS